MVPPFEEILPKFDADKDGRITMAEGPDDRIKNKDYFAVFDLNKDGSLDAKEWDIYRAIMAAENGLLSIKLGGHGVIKNDDTVVMAMSAGTHIDALGHVSYGGFLYNGFPDSTVSAGAGLTRCGADKIGPLMSRGVLLDLPAAMGVERLEPGDALTAGDLDAAVELARVTLEPGDIACVRTGQMQLQHEGKTTKYNHDSPGLSAQTIPWIYDHDLGAVFTDTYVYEVWPPEDWAALMVVHMIHLRDMGQLQGQNFDFEALAAECAADGTYEFLFTAVPEPFTGGCSAPVAPVATR